jgi:hypothetical protein
MPSKMTTTIRGAGTVAGAAVAAGILMMTMGGCARPAAVAPAVPVKEAREPASVAIEYEVSRKGDDPGVLLRGRTTIDGRHDARVERRAKDREDLKFAAWDRGDGSFDVEVKYREVAPDGTDLAWQPLLHVVRGVTANAEVAGAGWARALSVRVE